MSPAKASNRDLHPHVGLLDVELGAQRFYTPHLSLNHSCFFWGGSSCMTDLGTFWPKVGPSICVFEKPVLIWRMVLHHVFKPAKIGPNPFWWHWPLTPSILSTSAAAVHQTGRYRIDHICSFNICLFELLLYLTMMESFSTGGNKSKTKYEQNRNDNFIP